MSSIIDVHVHLPTSDFLDGSIGPWLEPLEHFFRSPIPILGDEEFADEYRHLGIIGVILAWDARTGTGRAPVTNDRVAALARRFPDQFIPFASVDPHRGSGAIADARRAVNELGCRGFKFQQAAMAFTPSDSAFYPLWEAIQELQMPCLFHVGTTGMGATMAGGGGIKLDFLRPIHLDQVAADFPELPIIAAHPAWPWTDEMIAIALHKKNVWIDLSGWAPKYWPEQLKREIGGRLRKKALFGSDYPFLRPERWLSEFDTLGYSDDVRADILGGNARRLLGIGDSQSPSDER